MADSRHTSFSPTEIKNSGNIDAADGMDIGFDSPSVNIDHDHPRQPSFLGRERDSRGRSRRNLQNPKTPGYLVLGVRGAIVLGLVIFVGLLWAFVMGMFYGRGTEFQEKGYKELVNLFYKDHDTTQGTLKKEDPKKGQASDNEQPSGEEVIPKLEKDVVGWLADPTPKTKPAPPAPQPKPAPEPKPIPKPVAKPAPAPQPAIGFTVQVAATKNEVEAQTAVDELKARGFDAYFYRTLVGNSHFYRVRVGSFQTREEAIEEVNKLETCGFPKGYVALMNEE